jgi:hypothetical protein
VMREQSGSKRAITVRLGRSRSRASISKLCVTMAKARSLVPAAWHNAARISADDTAQIVPAEMGRLEVYNLKGVFSFDFVPGIMAPRDNGPRALATIGLTWDASAN